MNQGDLHLIPIGLPAGAKDKNRALSVFPATALVFGDPLLSDSRREKRKSAALASHAHLPGHQPFSEAVV